MGLTPSRVQYGLMAQSQSSSSSYGRHAAPVSSYSSTACSWSTSGISHAANYQSEIESSVLHTSASVDGQTESWSLPTSRVCVQEKEKVCYYFPYNV